MDVGRSTKTRTRSPAAAATYPFLLGCVVSFLFFSALDRHRNFETTRDGSSADSNVVLRDADTDTDQRRSLRLQDAGFDGVVRQQQHYGQQMFMMNGNHPTTTTTTTKFVLGVFTTVEETERRRKLREYVFRNPSRVDPRLCALNEWLDWEDRGIDNGCQVLYTFVMGGGNPETAPPFFKSSWGKPTTLDFGTVKAWATTVYGLEGEADATYLNVRENMNEGKTPAWFRYVAELNEQLRRRGGVTTLDYAAKLDSDTLISIPDLIAMIDNELPPVVGENNANANVYGGILCDQKVACERHDVVEKREHCEKVLHGRVYMTGQFYFVSADLAALVAEKDERSDRSGKGNDNNNNKDDENKDAASSGRYSEDVDLALALHDSNRVLKLVLLNNKNVFWLHNVKTKEKMDSKYIDYFVKQRTFPKYSFWIKPNWWP